MVRLFLLLTSFRLTAEYCPQYIFISKKQWMETNVIRKYTEFADKQKFVEFMGMANFPDIKMTSHTNRCMIGAECDQSGQNWVIVSKPG